MPMIDISAYKKELLSDIINNPRIIEAIGSQQTDVVSEEPDSLLYRNIFPFLRVPNTENMADTYIMLSVDIDKVNQYNKTYAVYRVTMWVMAHVDRMEMEERFQATRIDYISKELDSLFDGQRKFGFSEFELISNREILLNEKFHYRALVFECSDLRRQVGG